jgi:LPXTG-motif cell wall-anchored protein
LLVFMALVNYADGPQWDHALVTIGMPLSYLLTLAGALLFGLGVWLLFRRKAAP